ncbi:MAG: DNA polymerase III subunit alpha [Eubacterium sp.]|nr:DNA polymerase III subunit alpha [Eubacterium sp.]
MAFTHLHTHTQYSLLDGSNKIKEYVTRVKELGMNAAAITDHGVMYGVIDFYKECVAQGINPVLGCEVYVAPGSRFDKEATSDDKYYHLILLAENDTGYHNLMKIVSAGFTEGFYYKPRVDKEVLRQYHEGIICLSACLAGEVQRKLALGLYEDAKEAALSYLEIFGEGNFFLELQDHGLPEQRMVNSQQVRLARDIGVELVATNDCHYTYEEDADAHDILLCLQTGKTLSDPDRMRYEGGQYFVKSEEEMRRLFPYAPEAIDNTQKIADRCHVEIVFHESKLPAYDTPAPYTSEEYLRTLCENGFAKRYPDAGDDLRERLEYELSVIEQMGYVDYFLIVWDFINYARENDIAVGPGRGSAAGSIVAYCLRITDIDPIKYNLVFERFLNPERVSMPDIDVDFCVDRRGEVINYVTQKYGSDKVTQIVTFGTLAARGVIRDVGRVMEIPYGFVSSVAKLVPQELNITLERALRESQDLLNMYQTDERVHKLIDMSRRLEGLPRHSSMHAAGVVISREPMNEYVPLARAQDGTITTQFTMTTIEELGLLKMDFLGLRNLTVIQKTVKLIERIRGEKIDIDAIDQNDAAVYEMISSGNTAGVFQLESRGMTSFMKELKPTCLEDVIAGIALYRPGPMDFIPRYIEGKKNPAGVVYITPELRPILEETYGCIVYQEQVMQIVRELAGYSWGRSDLVRRAMSKKKSDVMEMERRNFVYGDPEAGVDGCIRRGVSEEVAHRLFDVMTEFAKYAFNKSHAAAYAVVAYETAYLKCHYPTEYMACLLSSELTQSKKISQYIDAVRDMGIPLLPPDVNSGEGEFTVRDGSIVYGLSAVKGVGNGFADALRRDREEGGEYDSLTDFCERMGGRGLNKRMLESLIKAGAFDSFEGTRKQYMTVSGKVLDDAVSRKKETMTGQMSILDFMSPESAKKYRTNLPNVGEYPKDERLAMEKEVLGIYVSGHPLDDCREMWQGIVTARAVDFYPDEEQEEDVLEDKSRQLVGGMIEEVTVKMTKKEQPMAFVTLEDLTGTVEVLVFPKLYAVVRHLLEEDEKIFISGTVSAEADGPSKLLANDIIPFDETYRQLWIRVDTAAGYADKSGALEETLPVDPGNDMVVVYINESKKINTIASGVSVDAESEAALTEIFGEGNIKSVYKLLHGQ